MRPSRHGAGHLALIDPAASAQEAAAIVAALEQFARATVAPGAGGARAPEEWTAAARQEATSREPGNLLRDPWINT